MLPQALGGLAVKEYPFPARCPRCRVSLIGKTYHGYLGHMGLHAYADRYFGGNLSAAARQLAYNGMAATDPAPWNGAFQRRKKSAQIYQPKGATMKTDFSQIKFDADKHRYFLGDKELRSVTNYIKDYQKPFDRDRIAAKTAAKENRSVAEVLAEWAATGEQARTLGTTVHSHIEKTLRGETNGQLTLDPFLSLNTRLPEIIAFDAFWSQLAPKVSYSKEHIEWVIGDTDLRLAGTVDTMLFSLETKKYHIWDWKTGKFDLDNKWENLLTPFDYLSAAKFNIYSLQVSLYRLIIERNTGLDLGDSYIVHLSAANGYQVHRAIDLRERLLDWMEVPFYGFRPEPD